MLLEDGKNDFNGFNLRKCIILSCVFFIDVKCKKLEVYYAAVKQTSQGNWIEFCACMYLCACYICIYLCYYSSCTHLYYQGKSHSKIKGMYSAGVYKKENGMKELLGYVYSWIYIVILLYWYLLQKLNIWLKTFKRLEMPAKTKKNGKRFWELKWCQVMKVFQTAKITL